MNKALKIEYKYNKVGIGITSGWHTWTYFNVEDRSRAESTTQRLIRLYKESNWAFRLVDTDDSDRKALRKLSLLKKI